MLALAGCSDPGFRGVPEVRVAQAGEVAHCELLSTISMAPSVYGPVLGAEGLRYARNKVLESARDDGADTVVFEAVDPDLPVGNVRGQAYRCLPR